MTKYQKPRSARSGRNRHSLEQRRAWFFETLERREVFSGEGLIEPSALPPLDGPPIAGEIRAAAPDARETTIVGDARAVSRTLSGGMLEFRSGSPALVRRLDAGRVADLPYLRESYLDPLQVDRMLTRIFPELAVRKTPEGLLRQLANLGSTDAALSVNGDIRLTATIPLARSRHDDIALRGSNDSVYLAGTELQGRAQTKLEMTGQLGIVVSASKGFLLQANNTLVDLP